MAEHEGKDLLRRHGVSVPSGRVAYTADEAVSVAAGLGTKVALKLSAPDLRHKTDSGALILGVEGADAVRRGFGRLRALPGRAGAAVLVEEMLAPGVELMIAVRRDGLVPVLVLALGGTWVEILDDAVLIPLPCTAGRVERAVPRLRGAPLLTGARGRAPVAVDLLCALAARVGDLALSEGLDLVELNPVIARPDRVTAADAVIRRRPARAVGRARVR
jgi:succinyl-CoA synthetase beta subunit